MDGVAATGVDVAAPVFGRYRIHELLGHGGMGIVHRAYDTDHRRTVALKRLPETGTTSASGPGSGGSHGSRPGSAPERGAGARLRGDRRAALPGHDAGRGQRPAAAAGLGPAHPGTCRGAARPGRVRAGRRSCRGPGAPRREAVEHPGRRGRPRLSGRLRHRVSHLPRCDGADRSGPGAGTWDSWRRSGCPVARWTGERISTPWPVCCSSASPAACRIPVASRPPWWPGTCWQPAPAPSVFAPTVWPALDAVVLRGMAKDPARRFPSCARADHGGAVAARATDARGRRPRRRAAPGPGQAWLVRAVVRAPAPAAVRRRRAAAVPVPGLRGFERADAAWFHGRDRMVTDLLVRLAEQVRHARPGGAGRGVGVGQVVAAARRAAARAGHPAGGTGRSRAVHARRGPDRALAAAIAACPAARRRAGRGHPARPAGSASGAGGAGRPGAPGDRGRPVRGAVHPRRPRRGPAGVRDRAGPPGPAWRARGAGRPGRPVHRPAPAAARAGHAGVPGAVERDRARAGRSSRRPRTRVWRSSRVCRSA